jgi:hypothetical protein
MRAIHEWVLNVPATMSLGVAFYPLVTVNAGEPLVHTAVT